MERLIKFLQKEDLGKFLLNESIAKYTTFKVGGKARVVYFPKDVKSLKLVLNYIKENELRYKVFGKGSNILASDNDFDGVIIKITDQFTTLEINNNTAFVGGGYPLILLAYKLANKGLSGFEFASGIPGTIGGAVKMNAGAYNMEIADIYIKGLFMDMTGNVFWISKKDMGFSYRHSILHKRKDLICLGALFLLKSESKDFIFEIIKRRKEYRAQNQPLTYPSAGSIFRNEKDNPAWKLIEGVGMRGYKIGGAVVSKLHTNYIVNDGGCKASDVKKLIDIIRDKVEMKYGITLKTEIEFFNWE